MTIKIGSLAIVFFFMFNFLAPTAVPQDAARILKENRLSMVSIFAHQDVELNYKTGDYAVDTAVLAGSGFIISPDGLVATCLHVLSDIDSVLVKTGDGIFYPAALLYADTKNDIAVLRIECEGCSFRNVKLGDSDSLTAGQTVYAVGNPLGYELSVSQGIISGIRDNENTTFVNNEKKIFTRVIQSDAALSPGNSGGALFNSRGEVIGISGYSYSTLGNLYFSVAVNSLKNIMNPDSLSRYLYTADSSSSDGPDYYKLFKYVEAAKYFMRKVRDSIPASKPCASPPENSGIEEEIRDTHIQDSLNNVYSGIAESLLLKCLQEEEEYFEAYEDLMEFYLKKGRTAEAESLYFKAAVIYNEDEMLTNLAKSLERYYLRKGELGKVPEIYKGMNDESLKNYRMGIVFMENGDRKKAKEQLLIAVNLNPKSPGANYHLGWLYFKDKYYSTALKFLEKAMENLKASSYGDRSLIVNCSKEGISLFELYHMLGVLNAEFGRPISSMYYYLNLRPENPEQEKKSKKLYKKIISME